MMTFVFHHDKILWTLIHKKMNVKSIESLYGTSGGDQANQAIHHMLMPTVCVV